MKYGYARVSTYSQAKDGNSLEYQIEKLELEGCTEIYQDTYTGTKSDRPNFTKLLSELKPGDTLVVSKLDRFSRSASEGIKLVDELLNKGIRVHILNMGLMDNTPTGRLIKNIFLSFAEFERDMIVERTQEGKAIARTKDGFKEGRPNKFTETQLKMAADMKLNGSSYKDIDKELGISKPTLYRYMLKNNLLK